ncbi:MAG: 6,7-dimethyl-8-ribityllumazine synthase [Chloroflexi bacterium]|nr:6,7-dimethyl-8-ribityllumazine synthase [Chloroflexota bacterium]
MPALEGSAAGEGLRICVVVARWNGFVTEVLHAGAVSTLRECGLREEDVTSAWVPGAFEVPTAARWAAESGRFDAIICLGAVIRGETAHFEYVAGGAAEGITRVSQDTGVPVIFGVLTVDSVQQALDRAGGKEGHKGEESARAAIEMANLRKLLA